MVFHRRLSDSKSPQVSRTLLSILAVFNNGVVWMVSAWLPTSKSSKFFNNPLVTVPKAPITIGISVTFMFYGFFNSLARSRYLSLFSHSFSFILWSAGTAKSTILQVLFFCWLLLSLVFWPGLSNPSVCQSPIGVYVCIIIIIIIIYFTFFPLLLIIINIIITVIIVIIISFIIYFILFLLLISIIINTIITKITLILYLFIYLIQH